MPFRKTTRRSAKYRRKQSRLTKFFRSVKGRRARSQALRRVSRRTRQIQALRRIPRLLPRVKMARLRYVRTKKVNVGANEYYYLRVGLDDPSTPIHVGNVFLHTGGLAGSPAPFQDGTHKPFGYNQWKALYDTRVTVAAKWRLRVHDQTTGQGYQTRIMYRYINYEQTGQAFTVTDGDSNNTWQHVIEEGKYRTSVLRSSSNRPYATIGGMKLIAPHRKKKDTDETIKFGWDEVLPDNDTEFDRCFLEVKIASAMPDVNPANWVIELDVDYFVRCADPKDLAASA